MKAVLIIIGACCGTVWAECGGEADKLYQDNMEGWNQHSLSGVVTGKSADRWEKSGLQLPEKTYVAEYIPESFDAQTALTPKQHGPVAPLFHRSGTKAVVG